MGGPRATSGKTAGMFVGNADAADILRATWPKIVEPNVAKMLERRGIEPQIVYLEGRRVKLWPRRDVEAIRDERAAKAS